MWVWVCVVHGCEDVAYSVWWGSKGGYVYQKVSGVGGCGCGHVCVYVGGQQLREIEKELSCM